MSVSSVVETEAARPAAAASSTSPFYWSVRREIWEYRSIYLAPLIAAGLVVLGFFVRAAHLPALVRETENLPPVAQMLRLAVPFSITALAITLTGLIVAFFYCLGALYNERRDRSILFWKSLPVSNTTTVLSKVFVALAVIPAVVFLVTLATQLIMLLIGTAVLAANGVSAATLWANWPFVKMAALFAYILVVMILWYAPIAGWLLLVSAYARSMAILWAVLPPLGLIIAERIALDTSYVADLVDYRLNGFMSLAFYYKKGMTLGDPLALATPAHFFGSPGLWSGLAVAAALIVAAIWLRRNREPI